MKTNLSLLLLVFGITLCFQNNFGNNNISKSDSLTETTSDSKVDLLDGSTYKNATLYTQAGNTIQGDISFKGDSVTINMKGTKVSLSSSLQKIQRIDVPVEPEFSDQIRYTVKNTAIYTESSFLLTNLIERGYQGPWNRRWQIRL